MQALTNNLNLCGIYMLTNIVNNHRYIGSSINIRQRLWKHRSLLRHNKHENSYLQNAWNKYKESSFIYSILEVCDFNDRFDKEQFYINTLHPEYNIQQIVDKSIISEESKIKMSKSRKRGLINGTIRVTHNIPVYVYFKDGTYIGYWESIAKASNALHLDSQCISKVISGKYNQVKGYKFFKEKQDIVPPFNKPTNSGKINLRRHYIVESEDEVLRFYGMQEIADYFNVSLKSLRQYTTGKHKFKRKYMIRAITAV